MNSSTKDPCDNVVTEEAVIQSTRELGTLARARRDALGLKQLDVAGLAGTGNRFIVDLESGKPTVQLKKVLDILDLLGLEVLVRPKTTRGF